MNYVNVAFVLARIAVALALLSFAADWRTPLLASWRLTALVVLIALPLAVMAAEARTLRARKQTRATRVLSGASLVLAIGALGTTAVIETSFRYQRHVVRNADPQRLERLGRHVLVGSRDGAELQALIERRALAGVFLSARNVAGQAPEAIRQRIDAWQAIRAQQGLPPLWIATDQEGGAVSRLSPPLTRMPSLAEIIALHSDHAERQVAIRQYASRQGRELAAIGVNLNFAPVVDLDHGIANPDDRLTRISSRAISRDPAVVTEVADIYCATLLTTGVHCTLKHFPGLGRVHDDTHMAAAELTATPDELAASDWLPFRTLMSTPANFTMLSHARLTGIDRERPASFSGPVVQGLLRESWKHDGILVTDDFSMGAVTLSREGAAGGAVAALNAGVDLILVSYDPDQYFPVMYALLAADRDGRLRADMLERSAARLSAAAGR